MTNKEKAWYIPRPATGAVEPVDVGDNEMVYPSRLLWEVVDSNHCNSEASEEVSAHGLKLLPRLTKYNQAPFSVHMGTVISVFNGNRIGKEIYEYQYSNGESIEGAIKAGFDGWLKNEFPVILSYEKDKAEQSVGVKVRGDTNLFLGPIVNEGEAPLASIFDDPKVLDVFCDELSELPYAFVKYFISRDRDGQLDVDVRVNGWESPAGIEFVSQYASEKVVCECIVKQYVCITKTVG